MKVELSKVIASVVGLNELLVADLPLAVTYKLSDTAKEVNEKIATFNEVRQSFLAKYGTKENGEPDLDAEAQKKLEKELNDLLKQEVEVNVDTIHSSELGDVKIKTVYREVLDWLLVR